ncbi:MAG: hypothetical protein QOG99_440 [Frankiales bacterium]|jgi:hypothetical protein|nr:hypothetical protein [Frankiales bacterium]
MRSIRWCAPTGLIIAAIAVPPLIPAGTSTAYAAVEPGSGFASYRLSANAPTLSFTEDNDGATAHPEAEGDLPEAVSTLGSTGGSYALSSAVWPGALAGNLGTLLIGASGGQVPDQASVLDDPVRAEAKNNEGSVSNKSYPGMTLLADSHPASASASAHLQGAQASAALALGNTSADSSTVLVGASTAKATSTGSLHDFTLAGGAVSIASVRSSASVVSDGRKATGSGSTIVSGATVAGLPVAIDGSGVHAASASQALPGQAQQTVNTALRNLGMTIALIGPTTSTTAGTASYVAATLVVTWMPPPAPGGPNTHEKIVVTLGGASAAASAVPGYVVPTTGDLPSTALPPTLPGSPGSTGQVAPQPNVGGPVTQPTLAAGGVGPAIAPVNAASTQLPAIPGPLAIGWLLAGIAAALVLGLGYLRRLPTAFATATGRCPWEVS